MKLCWALKPARPECNHVAAAVHCSNATSVTASNIYSVWPRSSAAALSNWLGVVRQAWLIRLSSPFQPAEGKAEEGQKERRRWRETSLSIWLDNVVWRTSSPFNRNSQQQNHPSRAVASRGSQNLWRARTSLSQSLKEGFLVERGTNVRTLPFGFWARGF